MEQIDVPEGKQVPVEVAIDNLLITTESGLSDAMVPSMEVAGHPFNNHVAKEMAN